MWVVGLDPAMGYAGALEIIYSKQHASGSTQKQKAALKGTLFLM